jgi:uncharacterized membrane protein YedE/YeeE
MRLLVCALAGLVFGFGLILSGMADPAKVLAFLDVAGIADGSWDPSLAFVMAGAIAVAAPGFRLALRRRAPLFDGRFHLPTERRVDRRLLGGAAMFGLGWGLSGFCPGPAILALPLGAPGALVFVAAMIAGFALTRTVPALVAGRREAAAPAE